MTADKELWCGRWIARHAMRLTRTVATPANRRRRRRHAGLVLELAWMLVLVALLPRGRKRR
jgi:hypothetical protein